MDIALIVLVALSGGLALAVAGLQKALPGLPGRLLRPTGIIMGGMLGLAVSLPVAIALNPLVGLQAGTFHNLMILAMCLGFLGFIVGSLAGLMYGGMILTTSSRTTHSDDAPPLPSKRGAVDSTVAARHDPPEKPRSGRDDDAATPTFGSYLAQAERPRDFKDPGGEG